MPQISVSVDVDTVPHYANFASGPVGDRDPLLWTTLPRMLDLFDEIGVSATFFVITQTAERAGELLRRAVEEGHELASHTHSHVQAFHTLDRSLKREEIVRSKAILEDLTGVEVVGFRAPGYNIDLETLEILVESGFRYDSSLFPGWFVAASKFVARLLSSHYQPFPTSPLHLRHWRAANRPFNWLFPAGAIAEFPIPTSHFGLPYFGTFHLSCSLQFFLRQSRWLARRTPIIGYELHPIEVADGPVIAEIPWMKNVPGVGKHADPWNHLRSRLTHLLSLGDVVRIKDYEIDDLSTVPARS